MNLVVPEWEIDALRLELSPRDGPVDYAIVGHSIVLIVYDKGIQKLKLCHLLHGSGPAVVLQSEDVLSPDWSLWGVAESVRILLESLSHLACVSVEWGQPILTARL